MAIVNGKSPAGRFPAHNKTEIAVNKTGSKKKVLGTQEKLRAAVMEVLESRQMISGSPLPKQQLSLTAIHADGTVERYKNDTYEGERKFPTLGVSDVVLQDDGKVVAGGSENGNSSVARYLIEGQADTSFGSSGKVTTDWGTTQDATHDIYILPDDRIVAIGSRGNSHELILARYNSNGAPDTSFGTGGKLATGFVPPAGGRVVAIVTPTGETIVDVVSPSGKYDAYLFTASGQVDATFNKHRTLTRSGEVALADTIGGTSASARASLGTIDGNAVMIRLSAHDLGTRSVLGWTIDWGDGGTPEWIEGDISSAIHTYASAPGGNTIRAFASLDTIKVADDQTQPVWDIDEDNLHYAVVTTNKFDIHPSSGGLDLDDNDLIATVSGTSAAAARNLIVKGRGGTDFYDSSYPYTIWQGPGGITSSAAAVNVDDPNDVQFGIGDGTTAADGISFAIGYVVNSDLPTLGLSSYTMFDGQTVDGNSLLIRFTRGADTDLDGRVNTNDINTVGAVYNMPGTGEWMYGDFDYDGMVDSDDVVVLGATYDATAPALSSPTLTKTRAPLGRLEADASILVPEDVTYYYGHQFESAAGTEWSDTRRSVTPAGARNFLGEFSNGSTTLSLEDIPEHESITVSFDLFLIRSWDGTDTFVWGPDRWQLNADGSSLIDTSFSNHITPAAGAQNDKQAYPDPFSSGGAHNAFTEAFDTDSLGYYHGEIDPWVGDSIYHIERTFSHNDSALRLDFAALGLQSISDESWGLDNVEVVVAANVDGTIRGVLWDDQNQNQEQDPDEDGLEGWRVFLDGGLDDEYNGEPSVLTDSSGRYTFSSLLPATYNVRVVVPSGWDRTLPQQVGYDIVLGQGEVFNNKNFGYVEVGAGAPVLDGTPNLNTGQIDLTWSDPYSNEDGWIVERALANAYFESPSTAFVVIADLEGADHTSFADSATAGQQYVYRVRAYRIDAGGRRYFLYSNDKSLELAPATEQTTPLLSAIGAVYAIRLDWTDTPTDETGWQVFRREFDADDPDQFVLVKTLPSGATYWTDTGLTPTVRYEYQVRALLGSDPPEDPSNNASAVPLSGTGSWYYNGFEGDSSKWKEWSNVGTIRAPLDGRGLLGTFGGLGAGTSLTWALPPHERVGIEFDLYILGTWDGDPSSFGGEEWWVDVDGERELIHTGFQGWRGNISSGQAYPDWYVPGTYSHGANTGVVEPYDTLGIGEGISAPHHNSHYRLKFEFEHSNPIVTFNFDYWNRFLAFGGLERSEAEDEVWALDNVRIFDADESGSRSISSPANLTAAQVTNDQIAVNWDEDPTATSYMVYMADRPDFPLTPKYLARIVPAARKNDPEFSLLSASWDQSATPTKYIKVTAVSSAGASEPSDEVSVVYQSSVPDPTAPASVWTTTVGSRSVRIEWSDTATNEAFYRVEAFSGSWSVISGDLPRDTTLFTDTLLTRSEERSYRVVAINRGGFGRGESNSVLGYSRPEAPTNVKAIGSLTNIDVQWDQGPQEIDHYHVDQSPSPAFDAFVVSDDVSPSTHHWLHSSPDSNRYYYRVIAVDVNGTESDPVIVSGVATADTTPPSAPTGLGGNSSPEAIDLHWDAGTESDLLGYKVFRRPGTGVQDWEPMQAPDKVIAPDTPWWADETAPLDVSFEYAVVAIDESFNVSDRSQISNLTRALDTGAPGDPQGLKAASYPDGIQLTWDQNEEEDFAGWNVYVASLTFGVGSPPPPIYRWAKLGGLITDTLGYNDPTAVVGEIAYYKVTSVDRYGNESGGVQIEKRRSVNGEPPAPQHVTAEPAGAGAITVTWPHVTPIQHLGYAGDARAGYKVYVKQGNWVKVSGTSLVTGNSFVYSPQWPQEPLVPGELYEFAVSTIDLDGDFSNPDDATAQTRASDGDLPAAPTLSGSPSVTAHTVTLSWSDGTANPDAPIDGYYVYRSLSAVGPYELISGRLATSPKQFEDTNLTPETQYWYRVRAVDVDNDLSDLNSANTVSATTSSVSAEPPKLRIVTPSSNAGGDPVVISADTPVRGYVDDWNNDLVSWELVLEPKNTANTDQRWVIAEGSTEVGQARETDFTDAALGTLFPIQIPDGLYDLVLRAHDDELTNNTSTERLSVQIKTNFKLGNFSLPVTDLSIEIPGGPPIQITRVYDTLNSDFDGDFGYGWRLDATQTNLRSTARIKPDDEYNDNEVPAFHATSRDSDLIYITLPGGSQHVFKFMPRPTNYNPGFAPDPYSIFYTGAPYEPHFVAVDGSAAKLIDVDWETTSLRRIPQTGELVDGIDGYNPAKSGTYLLTEPDGTRYEIDGSSGLISKMIDPNDNETNFDLANGIIGSQNRQLKIHREGGRIVWAGLMDGANDPAEGQRIVYNYSGSGELESVTDNRTDITTTYAYDGPRSHFLTSVFDDRNIEVLHVTYDTTSGKVEQVQDAYANEASIGSSRFSGTGLTQSVTNPGSTSDDVQLMRDEFGNVVRQIQAIKSGNGTIQKYIVTVTKYMYATGFSIADAVDDQSVMFNALAQIEQYKPHEILGTDSAGLRYKWQPQVPDLLSSQSFYIDDPASPNFKQLQSMRQRGPDGNFSGSTFGNYKKGKPQRIVTNDGRKSTISWNVIDDNGNLHFTIDQEGNGTEYVYSNLGTGTKGVLTETHRIFVSIADLLTFDPILDPPGPSDRLYLESANTYYGATDIGNGQLEEMLESTTDAAGKTTYFQYDAEGRVTRTFYLWDAPTGPDHWVVNTTFYDTAGRATSTTQAVYEDTMTTGLLDLHATSPDANGNLEIVEPLASGFSVLTTSQTHYDQNGKVDYTVDQHGQQTTNFFDALGNLVRVLSPGGTETRTAYDNLGRAVWQSERFFTGLDDADIDDAELNQSSFKSVVTHTIYDSAGRVVGTERYKDALIAVQNDTFALEHEGLFRSTAATPTIGSKLATTANELNEQGRVTATTTASVTDGSSLRTETQYYPDGRVRRTRPITTPSTPWTLYEYDLLDENDELYDKVTDARSGETRSYRDPMGRVSRVVDANGNAAQTLYWTRQPNQDFYPGFEGPTLVEQDSDWVRQEISIDQQEIATSRLYDKSGRLRFVILPDPDGTGDLDVTVWQYTYDEFGNQTQIIDPRDTPSLHVITTFTYDEFGRRRSRTLPEGQTETWEYDGFGRVTKYVNTKDEKTKYKYYTFGAHKGQLQSELRYRPTDNFSSDSAAYEKTDYTYDDLGRQSSVIEYANGNLSTIYRQTDYTYDPTTGGVTEVASPEGNVHYQFDPGSGRLKTTWTGTSDDPESTAGGGAVITRTDYTHDALGRLKTVASRHLVNGIWTSDTPASYEYYATGQVKSLRAADGSATTYNYDPAGRLTHLAFYKPNNVGGTYPDWEQLFDSTATGDESLRLEADGQRGGVIERSWDGAQPDKVARIDYAYDAWNRLTSEIYNYNGTADDYTTTFTFDAGGNRKQKSTDYVNIAKTDETVDYTYDRNDRVLAENSSIDANDVTYRYGAGSTSLAIVEKDWNTSTRLDTFIWDIRGRMTGATVDSQSNAYVYDHTGLRVRESDGTDTIKYVPDTQNPTGYAQTLEQWTNADRDVSYVWGLNLLSQERDGNQSSFVHDALGSVRFLRAVGHTPNQYDYDAFGQVISHSGQTAGQIPNVYLFAGEHVDGTLGQSYNRARWYDLNGRFTGLDAFNGSTANPQSLHKYAYAHGNPIIYADPSGRELTLANLLFVGGARGLLAGIVLGGSLREAAYFISTPTDEWSVTGALEAFAKGAATGALGATFIGSAYFAAEGIYDGIKIWRDPKSTGVQKALASVNMLIGMASAYLLKGQVKSQWKEWSNIYSKLGTAAVVQTDIQAIRSAYQSGASQIQLGKTTIMLGYHAPGRAAGVFAGEDNLFYLSKEFLAKNPTNDDIMLAIIEENIHLARMRANIIPNLIEEAGGMDFRQSAGHQAEEVLVGQLADDIFLRGKQAGWW